VVLQDNDYAWGMPLDLPKAELIEHLRGLNVEERVQGTSYSRLHQELLRLADGLTYRDRPVHVVRTPVGSTHGIFTKATEIRGAERLCLDLIDDPPFVRELLAVMTDLAVERVKCWHRLTGSERAFPSEDGWGCCDDSLTLLSRGHYEEFVLPEHERLYSAFTTGPRHIHLCGHVQHLFGTLHRNLGITTFDGPGTQVDLIRLVREVDRGVTIQAQVSHGILAFGPEAIERGVRHVLQEEVKRRVPMTLVGYAPRGTPPEHLRFFYECAMRHGTIGR
jgi:uroporphyrinogen-III decarboxylase